MQFQTQTDSQRALSCIFWVKTWICSHCSSGCRMGLKRHLGVSGKFLDSTLGSILLPRRCLNTGTGTGTGFLERWSMPKPGAATPKALGSWLEVGFWARAATLQQFLGLKIPKKRAHNSAVLPGHSSSAPAWHFPHKRWACHPGRGTRSWWRRISPSQGPLQHKGSCQGFLQRAELCTDTSLPHHHSSPCQGCTHTMDWPHTGQAREERHIWENLISDCSSSF